MSFRIPEAQAAKLAALDIPGVGRGMAAAQILATDWTPDDTERWLTDYPLPATFKWNGERAYPVYKLVAKHKDGRLKGYGFWLRTAGPYHPALRGLFVLCHEILSGLRPGLDPMPSQEQLAALLLKHAGRQLTLSVEDMAPPQAAHPAENVPTHEEPTGNPTVTEDEANEQPY